MALVVVKFGGTSVRNERARLACLARINELIEKETQLVAVVSAMGRLGEPYATDTLLSLLSEKGAQDLIMSVGETVSACVFTDFLRGHSVTAKSYTAYSAGIRGTGVSGRGRIYELNSECILSDVRMGVLPVLTGFQCVGERGEVLTLGRGGSDISAVVTAGLLGASAVIIYTDVDGVYDKNPCEAGAKRIVRVGYEQMERLALDGATVLHPSAVVAARLFGIPVWVRSVFSAESGSLIEGSGEAEYE